MISLSTRNSGSGRRGFTLVEVIAALALGGLLLAGTGFGLVATVRGYLLAEENAEMGQKAQMALLRLHKEYVACYDCDPEIDSDNDAHTLENPLGSRVLALNGSELTLNGDILLDRVAGFSAEYEADGRVKIVLVMDHLQGATQLDFSTSVLPRNTYK